MTPLLNALITKWRKEASEFPVRTDPRAPAAAAAVRLCADELAAVLFSQPSEIKLDHTKILNGDRYVVEVNGQDQSAHPYTVEGLVNAIKSATAWENAYPRACVRILNPDKSDDTNPRGLTAYEEIIIERLEV